VKASVLFGVLLTSVAIAGSVLPLVACGGSDDAKPTTALEGKTWVLTSYAGGSESRDVPPGVRVDAVFKDGTVGGQAPINTYSGPYTLSGDSGIDIGPVASTMMAGAPEAMTLEQAYFAALDKATAFAVEGETLTLSDADGNVLLNYGAAAQATITGQSWKVTGYNNGKQAVQSVAGDAELTAVFGDAGTVSGSAGVNTYNGPCTIDGQTISVGELATTMKSGSDALMKQETLYLAALQSAATWSVRGDALELRTADDAIAVTCTSGGPSTQ
jgi:heat shock protein HslJ